MESRCLCLPREAQAGPEQLHLCCVPVRCEWLQAAMQELCPHKRRLPWELGLVSLDVAACTAIYGIFSLPLAIWFVPCNETLAYMGEDVAGSDLCPFTSQCSQSALACGTGVASGPGTVGALSQAAWWPGTSFPSGSHQDWAWGCVLRSSDVSARRWNCARELTDGWRRRHHTVTGVGSLCNPSHCPHIWSVFEPHTVKPELCKWPYLLIKGIGNTVALHSYKLHY